MTIPRLDQQSVTSGLTSGVISGLTSGVDIETWFLRYHRGRWLTREAQVVALPAQSHPHDVALGVANEQQLLANIIHSTSWRMMDGRVVLTYVVVTEDDLGSDSFEIHRDQAHEFTGTSGTHASATIDPILAPDTISDHDVVHHALHHLALLASTNDSVADAMAQAARRSLRPLVPAGAGVLNLTSRVRQVSRPAG